MITKGRNRISRKLSFYLMAGTIISLSGASAPAHAGFNWTPPPPPPKASPAPDAVMVPLAPVEADAAPAPAAVTATAETVSWAPQNPPPAAAPAPVTYKEIRGFGKEIPLAMAINQIVPPDYTYSFAADVNSATAISWQGDRPWNVVLKESLEPAGLVAIIDNTTVKIEKWTDGSAGSWSAPPQTAMPAAPHYTKEQLAAIGGADNGNYRPTYPRHTPHKMPASSGAAEESSKSSDGMQWQEASSNDIAAAKDTSPASAEGQPMQLADKMQQQQAPDSGSSGMTWQPGSAPPPAEEKTASVVPSKETFSAPAPAPSLVPSEPKTAGAAAPAKAASMSTVSSWQAAKGESLHDTLSAWCGQSGVNLIWESSKDYRLPRTIDTKGTFTDAVLKLLTQYNSAKPRPVGQLHPNLPDGPPVLVIGNEAGA